MPTATPPVPKFRDPLDYGELQDDIDEATYLIGELAKLAMKYTAHPGSGLEGMRLAMAVTAVAKAAEDVHAAAGRHIDRAHGEVA